MISVHPRYRRVFTEYWEYMPLDTYDARLDLVDGWRDLFNSDRGPFRVTIPTNIGEIEISDFFVSELYIEESFPDHGIRCQIKGVCRKPGRFRLLARSA